MSHFPAAGEIVIFDRSWYNRAGIEHVLGFCTPEEHCRFLDRCPEIEQYIVEGGITLIKFWLEVGNKEQARRFEARIEDPLRQWKLSPTDLESRRHWYDYSRACDRMLEVTDTAHAPLRLKLTLCPPPTQQLDGPSTQGRGLSQDRAEIRYNYHA